MRSRYRCSMCPAIHINSRSWLRSSSTHEPSDPPRRMILVYKFGLTGGAGTHRPSWQRADGRRPRTRDSRRRDGSSSRLRFTVVYRRWRGTDARQGRPRDGDSLNLAREQAPPSAATRTERYPGYDARRNKRTDGRPAADWPRFFQPDWHPNARTERRGDSHPSDSPFPARPHSSSRLSMSRAIGLHVR